MDLIHDSGDGAGASPSGAGGKAAARGVGREPRLDFLQTYVQQVFQFYQFLCLFQQQHGGYVGHVVSCVEVADYLGN